MMDTSWITTILWQPSSNISRNPATILSAFSTQILRCFFTVSICKLQHNHWFNKQDILPTMNFIEGLALKGKLKEREVEKQEAKLPIVIYCCKNSKMWKTCFPTVSSVSRCTNFTYTEKKEKEKLETNNQRDKLRYFSIGWLIIALALKLFSFFLLFI